MGQKLTYDNVLEVLGAVDTDVFSRLLRSILERNVAKVLDMVEELVMQGRELTQLAADFTWYLRNLLLVKTSDNIEDVLDVSSENLAQLKEEAQMIEVDMLLRYIRVLSELSGQLKYATQKRVLLEVALIKLCTPAMEVNPDSLLDRIRALEEKVAQGAAMMPSPEALAQMQMSGQMYGQSNVPENGANDMPKGATYGQQVKKEVPVAIPEDVKEVVKNFRSIADETSGPVRTYLKRARLSLGGDNRLLVVLPDSMGASIVGREDHKEELESLIEQRIGKKVEVEVRQVEEGRRFEDTFIDLERHMEEVIHMEITVEED